MNRIWQAYKIKKSCASLVAILKACVKKPHLEHGMSIKFIEEVHNGVGMERCGTNNNMVLIVGSMSRVVPTQLLPFHPSEGQLLKLSWEDN